MKYRKRPVEVEAIQFTDNESASRILAWAGTPPIQLNIDPGTGICTSLIVVTLEGKMIAEPGWWIIKGVEGEFYPCRDDIFDRTYEPVYTAPDHTTTHLTQPFLIAECAECQVKIPFRDYEQRAGWVGKHRVSTGHTVRQYEETK